MLWHDGWRGVHRHPPAAIARVARRVTREPRSATRLSSKSSEKLALSTTSSVPSAVLNFSLPGQFQIEHITLRNVMVICCSASCASIVVYVFVRELVDATI